MTRTKKIITIVAAVSVVAIISAIGFASVRSGVADQIIKADAFSWDQIEGDGSEEHPYQIQTKEQLEKVRDKVNNINGESNSSHNLAVELIADIDLQGDQDHQWVPFNGGMNSFDGKGHTVSGIYINDETKTSCGFFEYNNFPISNLTVEGEIV